MQRRKPSRNVVDGCRICMQRAANRTLTGPAVRLSGELARRIGKDLMRVLVTGGAGYIGSHTVLQLLAEGHAVHIVDNHDNSSPLVIKRLRNMSNGDFASTVADIHDRSTLGSIFEEFQPDTVIHFAGLKAVGQSVEKPALYYHQNIEGAVSLLEAMEAHGTRSMIFSSSATVYGDPDYLPLDEAHPLRPKNPYGKTKYFIEELLRDWCEADASRAAIALRYFNPVGAHPSGQIGEDPADIPNNLLPYISQVAVGRLERLSVFGNDYDTPDGTGVRDYLHVTDLAKAHVAAANVIDKTLGFEAINLGTGTGYSVLDMVAAFERASGRKIPLVIAPRRKGDSAAVWADPSKAERLLGWKAELDLDAMCASAWNWQVQNPQGYR
jgi:UDP-glucose 4-epimerase